MNRLVGHRSASERAPVDASNYVGVPPRGSLTSPLGISCCLLLTVRRPCHAVWLLCRAIRLLLTIALLTVRLLLTIALLPVWLLTVATRI